MALVEARSPGSSDISAAISAALNGDTIAIPAGSATWTGNVTVPPTKGLKLIGPGADGTRITLGGYYLFLDTRPDNPQTRLSGVGFSGGTGAALRVNYRTIGARDFRVDHCSWAGGQLQFYGYVAGLVDNCSFTNCYRTFVLDGQIGSDAQYQGSYSWTQPIGGAAAVYFEDCSFAATASSILCNGGAGCRLVFRRNTINGPLGIETHSGCTNGYRNPRWVEIYENVMNAGTGYWCGMLLRSHNGLVYNNAMTGYQQGIRFDMETICRDDCNGPWNSSNKTVYPAQDQIGAGMDSGYGTAQRTDEAKLRFWGNTFNGAAYRPTNAINCAQGLAMVQEGRDYFFEAPAGHVQFAYPHPLRSEEPGFELGIAPSRASVRRPGEAVYIVTATAQGGYISPVTLAVEGLPAGAGYALDANPIPPNGQTTLRIPAGALADGTVYTLGLTGSGE